VNTFRSINADKEGSWFVVFVCSMLWCLSALLMKAISGSSSMIGMCYFSLRFKIILSARCSTFS